MIPIRHATWIAVGGSCSYDHEEPPGRLRRTGDRRFFSVLRSQLYGVDPVDPLTLASVVLVPGASAAVASWLPARRGASLDPATALRGD
jgi:hypothetical protein